MNQQALNESFICRFIRAEPEALYDIGVGPKTEWQTLGAKYPSMRIFGCEPNPIQHANLVGAKFPGPLIAAAIGEMEGVATLHYPSDDLKRGSLLPVDYADAKCPVEVWSLDRFDEAMGRPDRILLWMDVEGYELSALRSGRRLLESGRLRWINLEERRGGDRPAEGWCDPQELHEFLCSNGYVRVADYNRYSTHQDAIYVHRDEK
ncbi:MAG: FkbM family methyltransferase [Pirellulales bacterium]